MPDPLRYFRIEARELLDRLSQTVLDLEKAEAGPDLVQQLLRLAHTLKGAARVVRQREIADLAHALEEALAPWRDSADKVSNPAIDGLLSLLDDLAERIVRLSLPAPAAEATNPKPAPEEAVPNLRAAPEEIDLLLEGIAEAHARFEGVRASVGELGKARRLAELVAAQLAPRRARKVADAGEAASGPRIRGLSQQLHEQLTRVERALVAGLDGGDRELRDLRSAAESLRLVPAGALFIPLERTARDVAQELGRRVTFEGLGGDVRLDGQMLGSLQDALVQLVRNAVAHGIEPEAERVAQGKPASGQIVLAIVRRGSRATFRFRDDGRGVDLEAVRRAAQRRAPLSPELEGLGADELLGLLLRGGISTSGTVTAVAGRGVGLDVVREVSERLRGQVRVETGSGIGTLVELTVPLSVASLEALLVEAAGVPASLPLDAVRSTLRLGPGDIARTGEGESIAYEDRAIPYLSLAAALGSGSAARISGLRSAVLVEGAGGVAAIGVDRLLGTARVVLRPLPDLAPAADWVAGASLDSQGDPQLVLDADGLVREARQVRAPRGEQPAQRHPILVVDDSLTTRMLEQTILESAGYEVHLVPSGEDALEAARRTRFALFLVDVEMPGMDGFTFIERIRADPHLREVPAILVTSRAAPEDRRRGELAGAQGYIVKSEFDQADLLGKIRGLVG